MVLWDDRILEILEYDGPSTPSDIAEEDHIHVGRSNISKRVKKLNDHELIENLGNGVYQITSKGRFYLYGGYDCERNDFVSNGKADKEYFYDLVKMKIKNLKESLDPFKSGSIE